LFAFLEIAIYLLVVFSVNQKDLQCDRITSSHHIFNGIMVFLQYEKYVQNGLENEASKKDNNEVYIPKYSLGL